MEKEPRIEKEEERTVEDITEWSLKKIFSETGHPLRKIKIIRALYDINKGRYQRASEIVTSEAGYWLDSLPVYRTMDELLHGGVEVGFEGTPLAIKASFFNKLSGILNSAVLREKAREGKASKKDTSSQFLEKTINDLRLSPIDHRHLEVLRTGNILAAGVPQQQTQEEVLEELYKMRDQFKS